MKKFEGILFSIMLLMLISGSLCEFPRLVIPSSDAYRIIHYLLLPSTVIIFLNFGKKKLRLYLPTNFNTILLILIAPILLIFVTEFFLQGFQSIENTLVRSVLIQLILILLFLYISNVLFDRNQFKNQWLKMLLKPYVYFCLFVTFSSVSVFILMKLNIIQLNRWLIPSYLQIVGDFASGRVNDFRMPLYITLVYNAPFYGGLHRFAGLSIEPHTSAIFTAPSLFFLQYVFQHWSNKKKYIASGIIILHLLLTFSIMFFIAGSIIIILVIVRFLVNIKIISNIKTFIFGITSGIAIYIFSILLDTQSLYKVLIAKIEIELYSSQSHVQFYKEYFNLDYIFGTGLIIPSETRIVGFIFIVLYLLVIFISVGVGLRLYYSRTQENIIGLGIVYFFLHMFKDPFHALPSPFLLYLYFITALAMTLSIANSRKKAQSNNISILIKNPSN